MAATSDGGPAQISQLSADFQFVNFLDFVKFLGIVKYLVSVNIHGKGVNGNSASEKLDFVLLSRCSSGGNSLLGIHPLHPFHFFCSKAHIN